MTNLRTHNANDEAYINVHKRLQLLRLPEPSETAVACSGMPISQYIEEISVFGLELCK